MLFSRVDRRPWLPYLVALLIFAVAAVVRIAFLGVLGTRLPYVTFFPAVMLAVLFGGLPAGFVVTTLSALLAAYCWIEPVGHFAVRDAADWIGLVTFLLSCTMVCCLSEVTRRARSRASEAQTEVKLASQREQASAALHGSEARFRLLVEQAADAFFVHDRDGRFLDVNRRACESLGYEREELLRLGVFDIELDLDREGARRAWDLVRPGQHATLRGRQRRKDGSVFPVEVRLGSYEQNGEHLILDLVRDISEQLSLEAQLLQAQKMEAVGRLAAGVAHDFNNSLTVILGYAELSRLVEINGETFHDYLDEIIKAGEHSRDITQQLLAFSRNEIIAPRQLDLNRLIRDTDGTLARLIGEDVRLRLTTPDGIWPVLIDPAQMEQIIVNLAVNARDAMPEGGTLSIETRNLRIDEVYFASNPDANPGEYVQMTVSDTGVGMDREMLGHIFEPFFTTKGVGKGTGLGLATVYGIVSQNDGFIKVQSEPGNGAAFALFFPRMAQGSGVGAEQAHAVAAGEGRAERSSHVVSA